jgi:hypothetical protein
VKADDFGDKPQLLVAAICERALLDTDKMLTMVRLIDIVTVASDAAAETMSAAIAQQGAPIQATLVLVFKGGPVDTKHQIAVVAHSPSGDEHEFPRIEAVFASMVPGAVPGGNVIVNLQMSVKSEGTYWFEMKLDGETLTSVPLQIAFQGAPLER